MKFWSTEAPLPHIIPNITITNPTIVPTSVAISIQYTIHSFVVGHTYPYKYNPPCKTIYIKTPMAK